jgi:hypothetical protein
MSKHYSPTSNLTDLGIHVFEQNGTLDWELEIVSINLLSLLSWKRFHGPIHLYCNDEYLQTLKKWGVDVFYDKIDTDVLRNKPLDVDYKTFYAFSKIYVLSKLDSSKPVTMIDNDLWILDKLNFDERCDVIMYHKESFSENYHHNVYPDFDDLLPTELISRNFDKSVLPTNTAILHIRNCSFIQEWFNLSESIAIYNQNPQTTHKNSSIKMCFIEQRLLPMLLKEKDLTYSTFIDHIYQTHLSEAQDGSEWFPLLENSSKLEIDKFMQIKHVWGMKKLFHYDQIRNLVMSSCSSCLTEYTSVSDLPIVHELLNRYQPIPS